MSLFRIRLAEPNEVEFKNRLLELIVLWDCVQTHGSTNWGHCACRLCLFWSKKV